MGYSELKKLVWRQLGSGIKEFCAEVRVPEGAKDDDPVLAVWADGTIIATTIICCAEAAARKHGAGSKARGGGSSKGTPWRQHHSVDGNRT